VKNLPLWRRPFGNKRILEVGGGHNPYRGITHAVDKFPFDNQERGLHDYVFQKGVEFRQGELEKLPFSEEEKFDFIYVSHVFEHVEFPAKAVGELNRLTTRGYIETPAPIWEQLSVILPYNPVTDIHKSYVWSEEDHSLFAIMKSEKTIGEFCECPYGRLGDHMCKIHRSERINIERLLPGPIKTHRMHFRTPLSCQVFPSFVAACEGGHCAYKSLRLLALYTAWPLSLFPGKFRELKRVAE